jgi:hypothetical protein
MAIPGEIVRINVKYSMPGASEMLNVFFGEVAGLIADTALADAIDDWVVGDWGAAWVDFASSDVDLISWEADIVFGNGHVDRNLGGQSVGIAGGDNGDVEPAAVAGYVLAYTDYPKSRGSKYVPGLPDSKVVDGHITAGHLVNLAVLLLRLISFDGTALEDILWSGLLSALNEEFRRFNGGGTLTDVPAYQRRRKPNVGS